MRITSASNNLYKNNTACIHTVPDKGRLAHSLPSVKRGSGIEWLGT